MGNDILPGHVYTDGEFINGPSLTEHVGEATIKPSFYSARSAKDPAVLTDEFLVRDTVADAYRKVTLATLLKLMVGAGSVIQTSYGEYTANSNLTALIPNDDTIPQNTEGTEIVTASITPKFSSSLILVRFVGPFTMNVQGVGMAALFRDAAAGALAATVEHVESAIQPRRHLVLEKQDSPSSTSAITYRIRVGPNTGTMRMNGSSLTREFGGVSAATLTLQEIKQ